MPTSSDLDEFRQHFLTGYSERKQVTKCNHTSTQLRNLASRLLKQFVKKERTLISREIHDELGAGINGFENSRFLSSGKLRKDQTDLQDTIAFIPAP